MAGLLPLYLHACQSSFIQHLNVASNESEERRLCFGLMHEILEFCAWSEVMRIRGLSFTERDETV